MGVMATEALRTLRFDVVPVTTTVSTPACSGGVAGGVTSEASMPDAGEDAKAPWRTRKRREKALAAPSP